MVGHKIMEKEKIKYSRFFREVFGLINSTTNLNDALNFITENAVKILVSCQAISDG